jgi:2-methylcitrate dehydratase PrpD
LRVRLNSGEKLEARISHNRGGPENPLSDQELKTKFLTNAERVLPAARVEELARALELLGGAKSIEETMEITRVGGRGQTNREEG